MRKVFTKSLLSFLLLSYSWQAHAWGERGHHLVCEEASRLVKEEGLKDLLKTRSHVMGHLCNVPDIHWKSMPSNLTRVGNPTHYIEPDMAGFSIEETPTLFSEFLQQLSQSGNAIQLVHKVGTLWWRAEQLYNLAVEAGVQINTSAAPLNFQEEQQNELPYNLNTYNMMLNMGLMGHYLGDASMPYHNWADYDGYASGHGGIHAYYESVCPGEFGSELGVEVRDLAAQMPSVQVSTVPTTLKKLSREAVEEVAVVEALDVVLENSSELINEHGMTMRKAALRPAPAEQCPKFRPLITLEMARSAKTLARLWDKIYKDSGKPNLANYKSYRYPLTPDFVHPSYLPTE